MSTCRSACAVLAGAAVITLAGCGSSVSTSGAAGSSPAAGTPASTASAASASASAPATPGAFSGPLVSPASLPFPIALGNTWVYQTVSSINNAHALVTRKVLSVAPVAGGHRVTMSYTVTPGVSPASTQESYIFYADGKIGYPVTESRGVSVIPDTGITWPDAADLGSGRVYRSTELVRLSNGQEQTADVTVQGGGTTSVTVPAGTYQATLVTMTMTTKVGDFTTTAVVKVWTAAGTGPVKSEELVQAGGNTELKTTEELLIFTRG